MVTESAKNRGHEDSLQNEMLLLFRGIVLRDRTNE